MKTPKIIESLAEKIMEAHKKRVAEDSMQKHLEENLRDTEKAISNLISCMEQGIVSNSTKQRLLELSRFTLFRNCKERGNVLTHACNLFVLPCDGLAIVRTHKLVFFLKVKSPQSRHRDAARYRLFIFKHRARRVNGESPVSNSESDLIYNKKRPSEKPIFSVQLVSLSRFTLLRNCKEQNDNHTQ